MNISAGTLDSARGGAARVLAKTGVVFAGVILINWALSSVLVPVLFPGRLVQWHSTLDAACLTVALFAFLISWSTYDRRLPFISYLGFGFLLVALLDTSYILSFSEQGYINSDSLLLWFFGLGRMVEALVFLSVLSGIRYTVSKPRLLLIILSVFGSLLLFTFSLPAIPVHFVHGSPIETVTWGVFLGVSYALALALAYRNLKQGDTRLVFHIGLAVLCTAAAQGCFVFLSNETGYWIMGHHFKLCGYWFVLRLLISEAVVAPFQQLAKQSTELERGVQERMAAEQEMVTMNRRLDYILTHNPAVVFNAGVNETGEGFRIDYVSSNVKAVLGYEPREFTGSPDLLAACVHPEDVSRVHNRLSELMRQGYVQADFRFRHQDGTYRWTHVKARLMHYEEDGQAEIIGCLTDLTERKRIEGALVRTEREKELILSTLSEQVLYYDLDMRVIWANAAAGRQGSLGVSRLVGRHCYRAWHGLNAPCPGCPVAVTLRTGTFQEGEVTTPNGITWYIRSHPVKDDDGNLIGTVEVALDVTERKKMEERLDRSQRQVMHIFESITDGFLALDEQWLITYINREAAGFVGKKANTLIGKTLWTVFPELNEAFIYQKLQTALRKRKTISFEVEIDDRWWEIRAYPSSDGLAVYFRDISDRRQAEESYIKLERLNVIGEMAAGIAHEVRNPMTSARGFLQILEEKTECRPFKSYFELIISEIDRANDIISEFLALARNRPVHKQSLSLNRIIDTIRPLIEADGAKRDKYVRIVLGDIPELILSEKEIRQLILNLVRNGLEAMDAGGVLTISTGLDGQDVVLTVRDQGRGIPPDILDKLGTPFVTTKEGGTGLGLAVCYSIAGKHNAQVLVDTSPAGTTFFIRFPVRGKRDGQ